jgi:hypothetical protein
MVFLGLSVLMIIGLWLTAFGIYMNVRHLILLIQGKVKEIWIVYTNCLMVSVGITLLFFTVQAVIKV